MGNQTRTNRRWRGVCGGGAARRRRAGFSQLELMFAIATALVGVLAFSNALLSSQFLSHASRERSIAVQGARRMLEELQDVAFADVWASYNADPDDDPLGIGLAPGSGFEIEGLDPVADDPDGLVGEILFPDVDKSGTLVLREDLPDVRLGMPRDLDGNGVIDSDDHASDYVLLPVLVRVRYRGRRGEGLVELRTLLADR